MGCCVRARKLRLLAASYPEDCLLARVAPDNSSRNLRRNGPSNPIRKFYVFIALILILLWLIRISFVVAVCTSISLFYYLVGGGMCLMRSLCVYVYAVFPARQMVLCSAFRTYHVSIRTWRWVHYLQKYNWRSSDTIKLWAIEESSSAVSVVSSPIWIWDAFESIRSAKH